MTQTTRRTGEQTRHAILLAAAAAFRERGYDVATLEDVAVELGVTRSAVLHHFRSKSELLHEIVTPLLADLDDLLDRAEGQGLDGPRRRRAFVTELVDVVCDRRCVASMLGGDITAQGHLEPGEQFGRRAARVVRLLAGDSSPRSTTKAWAALGTILRPVITGADQVDLSGPQQRRVLVDCALAALRA